MKFLFFITLINAVPMNSNLGDELKVLEKIVPKPNSMTERVTMPHFQLQSLEKAAASAPASSL
jgi:hypothetical protein